MGGFEGGGCDWAASRVLRYPVIGWHRYHAAKSHSVAQRRAASHNVAQHLRGPGPSPVDPLPIHDGLHQRLGRHAAKATHLDVFLLPVAQESSHHSHRPRRVQYVNHRRLRLEQVRSVRPAGTQSAGQVTHTIGEGLEEASVRQGVGARSPIFKGSIQ